METTSQDRKKGTSRAAQATRIPGGEPASEHSADSPDLADGNRWIHGLGFRILSWVVLLFSVVLIFFVALDLHHESRALSSLGAPAPQVAAIRTQTIWLHAVHGVVTVGLFAIGIHLIVRRLVTKRIAVIVEAVRHFRLGTWRARIPQANLDEIEWLAEAFRQLGPHLAQKVQTFVEADRKATVARMSLLYEARLTPSLRRTLTLARSMTEREPQGWAWIEVERAAMKVLSEVDLLGRPDHPSLQEITRMGPALSPGVRMEGSEPGGL